MSTPTTPQGPTFETAKRCPRCDEPGEDMGSEPTKKPNVRVHTIYCRNQACRWFNTPWVVQVNADGSIPPARENQAKAYPGLFVPDEESRIVAGIQRQLDQETKPGGGEIGGRR